MPILVMSCPIAVELIHFHGSKVPPKQFDRNTGFYVRSVRRSLAGGGNGQADPRAHTPFETIEVWRL